MRSFEIATELTAPPDAVWQRVVTGQGINDELVPLIRMTMPRGLHGVTIGDVAVGQRLGRSWLLLFGLIPVDYDDLTIVELAWPALFGAVDAVDAVPVASRAHRRAAW